MKKVIALLLVVMVVFAFAACTQTTEQASESQEEAAASSAAPATQEESAEASSESELKDTYEFAFVIPGTDSQYWNQYCGTGFSNAVLDLEEKYGVTINTETYGPAAEGSTDEYMSILESVIAKKPDVIITATMQPDGTAPLIKAAWEQGIYVNLFSLGITGNEEYYGALYYCDQPEQGVIAANEFARQIEEKGLPTEGVVGMHLATLVPILVEKMDMFKTTLNSLYPDIEVLDVVYNENDVNNAQSNVENQIATYGDELIGFFGGNNLSGDGIVLAVKNAGIGDQIASVAVDSDDIEIQGLEEGNLGAIVLQTPYEQTYDATYYAFEGLVNGYTSEKEVNIPAQIANTENMDDPEVQALLNPLLLKQ